jgi:O-methyltransferase
VTAPVTPRPLDDLRSWLLSHHGETVDPDRLAYVRAELERIAADGVRGPVVELGCFRGAMTLWMRTVLDELGEDREIHVFDSFEGLPESMEADEIVLPRGVLAATVEDVAATFQAWGKTEPLYHPGWFEDTLATQLPDRIAFGYLDGDLYSSTAVSLRECVPRLVPGGALILDDYADPAVVEGVLVKLPGVKRAADDYFGPPAPVEALPGPPELALGRYLAPRAKP